MDRRILGVSITIQVASVIRVVSAGELIPYSLPPPLATQRAMETISAPATFAVPEDTYQKFAQRVRLLKPAQRTELIARYQKSSNDAAAAGDASRRVYYTRLVAILRSP